MEQLIYKLKQEIIEVLDLDDTPEEIIDDAPLFGGGLGLDSIDAIELLVLLEKKYNIKVTNRIKAREIFVSVRTLAEFIQENTK